MQKEVKKSWALFIGIGTMMIASLSLTPHVYGKFSGSVDDTEVE